MSLAVIALLVCGAGPASATYRPGDDWRHVDQTLHALHRRPPRVPVVYLLGGSSARESITSEAAWSAQIAAFGGGRVRALDFGASSQPFQNAIRIVRRAPHVPSIFLIGVNLGRYTVRPPRRATSPPSRALRAGGGYDPHRFHAGHRLTDETKRALVRRWLSDEYPRFRRRYAGNARTLRELIAACQDEGFYPVLVELPLNLRVVGHAFDAPRRRYRRDVRAAAADYGIPSADFVARIGLRSSDFFDLVHLVEPGRAKYQRRLSQVVVARLEQYGLAP